MDLTCRTCLHKIDNSNKTNMQLIYENNSLANCDNLVEETRFKMEELIGFKIILDKIWPNRICPSCLKSLNAAHDFRMMCIENQEKLANIKLETFESEALNPTLRNSIKSEASGGERMAYVENETKNSALTKNNVHKRITNAVRSNTQKQNSQGNQKSLQKFTSRLRDSKMDLSVKVQNSLENQNDQNSIAITGISVKSLELKVICEICGMKYRSQSVLTLHMRRHLQIKPFECEICYKSFVSKPQLERHMRVHTGDRPFTCKFCDRKFGDLSTIKRHERIHTKERPYVCKCCSKSFTYLSCLKDHMVTHTGEKQFRCDPCNKIFARKKLLKQHIGTLIHQQVANECQTEMQTQI